MSVSDETQEKIVKYGGGTLVSLALLFGVGGCMDGCYNSNQHDQRVQAAFRQKIFENKRQPQDLIKVSVDGVTREGPLNKGAAIASGDATTAFIVAADPQSECWYSTLRVTDGQRNLPRWERIFGGELDEKYYMNSAFNSGHNCAPVATHNSPTSVSPTLATTPTPSQ